MAAFFVLAGRQGATQGARGCLKIHLIQAYEVGAHGSVRHYTINLGQPAFETVSSVRPCKP